MIRHMVLFTLHDGVSADDPRVCRAIAAEHALAVEVPTGQGWRFGANPTGRPETADFAGTGDFGSFEELRAFLEHPAHREAAGLWTGLAHWLVADVELA